MSQKSNEERYREILPFTNLPKFRKTRYQDYILSYIQNLESMTKIFDLSDYKVLIPSISNTLNDIGRKTSFLINIFTYLKFNVDEIIIFYHNNGNIVEICTNVINEINSLYIQAGISPSRFGRRLQKIKFLIYRYDRPTHIGIARMAIAKYLFLYDINSKIIISDDRRFLVTSNFKISLAQINSEVEHNKIVSPAKKIDIRVAGPYPTQIIFAKANEIKNVYRNAFKMKFLDACFPRIMEDYNFANFTESNKSVYVYNIERGTLTETGGSVARKPPTNDALVRIFGKDGQQQTKIGVKYAKDEGAKINTSPNEPGKIYVARGYQSKHGEKIKKAVPINDEDPNRATYKYLQAERTILPDNPNSSKYSLEPIQSIDKQILKLPVGKRPQSSDTDIYLSRKGGISRDLSEHLDKEDPIKLNPFLVKDIIRAIYSKVVPSIYPSLQQYKDQRIQSTPHVQQQEGWTTIKKKIPIPTDPQIIDRQILAYFNRKGLQITKPLSLAEIESNAENFHVNQDPLSLERHFTKPYLVELFKEFLASDVKSLRYLRSLRDKYDELKKQQNGVSQQLPAQPEQQIKISQPSKSDPFPIILQRIYNKISQNREIDSETKKLFKKYKDGIDITKKDIGKILNDIFECEVSKNFIEKKKKDFLLEFLRKKIIES